MTTLKKLNFDTNKEEIQRLNDELKQRCEDKIKEMKRLQNEIEVLCTEFFNRLEEPQDYYGWAPTIQRHTFGYGSKWSGREDELYWVSSSENC